MKDLIRTRHQIDMYYNMGSQLKGMSLQLGSIQATSAISNAIKSASSTITAVNESISIKEIMQITKEFAKEQAKMQGKSEAVFLF
jgi:hypothetical protein